MKSSTSESKPFQSRFKAEIPGLPKRKEREGRWSRSKFKYALLLIQPGNFYVLLNSMY